jgi:hypothetical protein
MLTGVGASFASTLASQGLIRLVERDRALWPYAAYRGVLAGVVLARLGRRRARRLPDLESRLVEMGSRERVG